MGGAVGEAWVKAAALHADRVALEVDGATLTYTQLDAASAEMATTLIADAAGSSHWNYRGFIPDPGVNAIEALAVDPDTWILSQSIADRTSCDYDEHRRELRLKRVDWGPNATFGTSPWKPCTHTP